MAAGIAGGLALTACSQSKPEPSGNARMAAAIAEAEAARPHSGRTVTAKLTPQQVQLDLGGPVVRTLAFGTSIPGPVIRASIGDEVVVTVSNRLDHPTSVHWHGIALRNDMDGAEPATPNIAAGHDFTYRFSVPNSGTYWAHPHTGLDEDTGLYLPVIVDDPTEGNYDTEWIVVLDDWTDGAGKSPQQLYNELSNPNKPPQNAPETTDDHDDHDGDIPRNDDRNDVDQPDHLVEPDTAAAGGRRRHQRSPWRRRRRYRLPVLSDQRTNPRLPHDI